MHEPPASHSDVVLVHLGYLREKMDEVVQHMEKQNGKLEQHGQAIAILQDRATEARATGAKWGAGIGAVAAGIITAIWQILGWGK